MGSCILSGDHNPNLRRANPILRHQIRGTRFCCAWRSGQVRSMRMLRRSVPTRRTTALFPPGSFEAGVGSSSGSRCAMSLCQLPFRRTPDRGSALMILT